MYFKSMKPANAGFQVDGIPFFVFSIYFCIIWTLWFGLRWAFTVLPEVLVRLFEFAFGSNASTSGMSAATKFAHYVDYLRYLKFNLAFLMVQYSLFMSSGQ